MRQFQEGAAVQVATIVRDLETAMKRHWEVFGSRACLGTSGSSIELR